MAFLQSIHDLHNVVMEELNMENLQLLPHQVNLVEEEVTELGVVVKKLKGLYHRLKNPTKGFQYRITKIKNSQSAKIQQTKN